MGLQREGKIIGSRNQHESVLTIFERGGGAEETASGGGRREHLMGLEGFGVHSDRHNTDHQYITVKGRRLRQFEKGQRQSGKPSVSMM